MIRYLEHDELDKNAWDNCVEQSPEGQIFSYSWYLDTCFPGWTGLVEGDYTSVFPIAYRSKMGIKYIFQPYFTRHFGVTSIEKSTSEQRLDFLKAIPKQFKYLDFCLSKNHIETPEHSLVEQRHYQELDLSFSYDQIAEKYQENNRRSLRKAEKSQFSILPDYNPDSVVEQFRILKKRSVLAFDDGDYKILRQLMKVVTINSKSKCHAAITPSGEVLAAAFFMISHNRVVYLKGFSSDEGRATGAMHFIFDRLIRSLAGTETTFDFGGSDVEGVARFFKGFGATDSLYLRFRQNRLPQLIRWLKS